MAKFEQIDTDDTGTLSLEEWLTVVKAEGVPEDLGLIAFHLADQSGDGLIDYQEFVRFAKNVETPLRINSNDDEDIFTKDVSEKSLLNKMASRVAGEPHFLNELVFVGGQSGGSHLGGFFELEDGSSYYVKFPGLDSIWHDDQSSEDRFKEILEQPQDFYSPDASPHSGEQSANDKKQTKSEVLVSKLYSMVGVDAAVMRFITIEDCIDGPVGVWSRNQEYEDIPVSEMAGLSGLLEGFAADAWLANWDVIGNGSPAELNMKRTKDGRAFRLDFGACLQYRATGGDKSETGVPFGADAVPELENLPKYNAEVFGDISREQIAAGVARIVVVPDRAIRQVVQDTLREDAGNIAEILIGRRNFLKQEFKNDNLAALKRAVLEGPEVDSNSDADSDGP